MVSVGFYPLSTLMAREEVMNIVTGLELDNDLSLSDDEDEQDCFELLKMARIHKRLGQEAESEQFYAALVQVLRPDHAQAELKI